ELTKATAFMPYEERVPDEFYRSGSKHKVLLKEIRETQRGKMIIVSRSDAEFVKALFRLEIPELLSETVEIKAIARESGQRSKVAVASNVEGIDPIGACVGQRGSRITAIMDELKMGRTEEKVDIILWDEDDSQFVINALSPAQVVSTKVTDKERKIIQVIVPDEQLSLAIGRDGQNVRLAAKLTGWNIDIQGETVKVENEVASPDDVAADQVEEQDVDTGDSKTENELEALGLSSRVVTALEAEGITTKEELSSKMEEGEKIPGIGPKAVEEINKALNY
ncbi:transcription termination factor NusA, partial [Candidatus Dojkabacteria bacterium]|nr:transcription termination factor NusA [Candidatus Dojkabacteria bacterium]